MNIRLIASTATVAVLSVALANCSGGGGSAPSPLAPVKPPQAAPATAAAPSPQNVVITINIPGRVPADARKPAYIGAGTQSATFAVSQTGATPSSPVVANCTSTCSATVSVLPGAATFTVNLYNGTSGTGALLSTGSATQTIIAGQVNSVNLTFNGVVAKASLALSPAQLPSGTAGTSTLTVQGLDASGNLIVGSAPFSNPITLASANGNLSLSATTVTTPGQTVTVSYNGQPVPGALAITATLGTTAAGSTTLQFTGASPIPTTPADNPTPPIPGPTASPTAAPTPVPSASVVPTAQPAVSTFQASGNSVLGFINPGSRQATIDIGSGAYLDNSSVGSAIPRQSYQAITNGSLVPFSAASRKVIDLDAARNVHVTPRGLAINDAFEDIPQARLKVLGHGTRSLQMALQPTPAPSIGAQQNWWVSSYTTRGVSTSVPMTMLATAANGKGLIWLDNTLIQQIGNTAAQQLAAQYATYMSAAIAAQRNFAPAPSGTGLNSLDWLSTAPGVQNMVQTCDANQNVNGQTNEYILDPGYVNVVVPAAFNGQSLLGYVNSLNLSPQAVMNCFNPAPGNANQSNQTAVVYVVYTGQAPTNLYTWQTTLTHELEHLTSFVYRGITAAIPFQARWVEEGMGTLAQDYTSANGKVDIEDTLPAVQTILSAPQNYTLTGFAGVENGTLQNGNPRSYALSWMFLKYLSDRFGNSIIQAIVTNPQPDVAGIAAATGVPYATLFADFVNTLGVSNAGYIAQGSSLFSRYNYQSFSLRSTVQTQYNGTVTLNGPTTVGTLAPNQTAEVQNMFVGGFAYFGYDNFLAGGNAVKIVDNSTGALLQLTGGIGQQ